LEPLLGGGFQSAFNGPQRDGVDGSSHGEYCNALGLPSSGNSDRSRAGNRLRSGIAGRSEQRDTGQECCEERRCISREGMWDRKAWRPQRPSRLSAFRSTQHVRIVALKSWCSRDGDGRLTTSFVRTGLCENTAAEKHRGRPGTLVGRGKLEFCVGRSRSDCPAHVSQSHVSVRRALQTISPT
jgi:hypothetical protein